MTPSDTDAPAHPHLVSSIVTTTVGFVLLGLLVGWLWSVLAHPPEFTVVRGNGVMDEVQAAHQFQMTVTFTWLSASAALIWGAVCSVRFSVTGWPQVVTTVAASTVAGVIAWRLGVLLGPPSPEGAIRSASVGDKIPTRLILDSHGILLVWPVVALVAFVVVLTWFVPDDPPIDPSQIPR